MLKANLRSRLCDLECESSALKRLEAFRDLLPYEYKRLRSTVAEAANIRNALGQIEAGHILRETRS